VSGSWATFYSAAQTTLGAYGRADTVYASGPGDIVSIGDNGANGSFTDYDRVNFSTLGGTLFVAPNSSVYAAGDGMQPHFGVDSDVSTYTSGGQLTNQYVVDSSDAVQVVSGSGSSTFSTDMAGDPSSTGSVTGIAAGSDVGGESAPPVTPSPEEPAPTLTYAGIESGFGSAGGDTPYFDDPVILSLKGGRVETQAWSDSGASFDMQSTGQKVRTGWATPGEGFLVYDAQDPDAAVTQGSQLVPGFESLRGLDDNGDGILNSTDQAWSDLRVWTTDGSANFQSDSLRSLNDLGISSIDLAGMRQMNEVQNGNLVGAETTFAWSDGTSGTAASVTLDSDPFVANPPNLGGAPSVDQLAQSIAAFSSFFSTGVGVATPNVTLAQQQPLLVAPQ
jgi:hypothetical protein